MSQFDLTNLIATLSDTQTTADHPVSQALMDKIRVTLEHLMMLLLHTGESGTVTSITNTVLTDSSQSWNTDEHIGRTLLITSGDAKGYMYVIDDNDATTLTCTGDTMSDDGVAVGDEFQILYKVREESSAVAAGHSHDGTNSRMIDVLRNVVADDSLETNEESTDSTVYVSVRIYYVYITGDMNTFGYRFKTKVDDTNETVYVQLSVGAVSKEITHNNDTYTTYTGTIDISSVSEDWKPIKVELKTSKAAGATARFKNFSFYLQ